MVPLCWPTFSPHPGEPRPHRSALLSGSRGWVLGTQPPLTAQLGQTMVFIASGTFAREGSGRSWMEAPWGCTRWPHPTPAPPDNMTWAGMRLRQKLCQMGVTFDAKLGLWRHASQPRISRQEVGDHPSKPTAIRRKPCSRSPRAPMCKNTQVPESIPASLGFHACPLNTTLL